MRIFRSASRLVHKGLCKGIGSTPPSMSDILKKHGGTNSDSKLEKDEISIILRKKKLKDRMVVEKIDKEELQPSLSIQEIRDLGKNAPETKPVEPIAKPAKTIDISKDYMAYSSKLEMYLRGVEPVPENIKYFKHGLPIPNIDPEFRGIEEIANILSPVPMTPNENLWLALKEVNGDSSYEDFQLAMKKKFNFELDFYGEEENVPAYQDMMVVSS